MTEASGAVVIVPLQTDQSAPSVWEPGAVWFVTHPSDIVFFPGTAWLINDYEWPLWDDWRWIENA